MATKKQILVGFLMILTVLVMLFFMTSDYSFSLSFRANSHPLKIKDEKLRNHPKFFGGEEVDVMVYKGKEGEVVPEGFIPKDDAPSKVIVINADDEKIIEEIADEMKEEKDQEWMVGDNDPEFPKVEINHEANVTPTDVPATTVKSTTTEVETSETPTTSTTTPTPTTLTTTETTTTTTTKSHRKRKGEKMVLKRDLGNMAHGTTETESQQIMTSSAATSSSSTSKTTGKQATSQQVDPTTKSPEKPQSESPEPLPATTQNISETGKATSAGPTGSQTKSQDLTETPKTETPGTGVPDVSNTPTNNTKNSTAAPSKVDKDSYQIHDNHHLDTVVIENNDLPEEFLSDDSSENSLV